MSYTLKNTDPPRRFDYFTIRKERNGEVGIIGWGTYPDSSVLSGQPMKCWLEQAGDEAAARLWLEFNVSKAAAEEVHWSSTWTEPQVSLAHLPDENDPVPGGMYPDDWSD